MLQSATGKNSKQSGKLIMVKVKELLAPKFKLRENIDEKELKELAKSMKKSYVIQPIVVREVNGKYEVICGYRRVLAAKMAKIEEIPAVVKNLDDREAFLSAIIENVQRVNLNPIEEAEAYRKLKEKYGMTTTQIAKMMGKDKATISRRLSLLKLDEDVQELVFYGKLSPSLALELLKIKNPSVQAELANAYASGRISRQQLLSEIKAHKTVQEISSTERNRKQTEDIELDKFRCVICKQVKPINLKDKLNVCLTCKDKLLRTLSE